MFRAEGRFNRRGDSALVTQLEADAIVAEKKRQFRVAFEQPDHPQHWARMVGPLMAWGGLLGLAIIGGLFAQ
jgi:hypothetical protein